MSAIGVLWFIAILPMFFMVPGLPLMAVLARRKVLPKKEALLLTPLVSISISVVGCTVLNIALGWTLSLALWFGLSALICIPFALLYFASLGNESLTGHLKWLCKTHLQRLWPLLRSRKAQYLILIVLLALLLTTWPKFAYPHPIHTDEWHYWAHSQSMMEQGNWTFQDAYYGYWSGNHAEGGFLLTLGLLQKATSLEWNTIFILGPMLITLMTVIMAFFVGERLGFGLPSALFVALLPSSMRFLGLWFLVPVSLGLMMVLGMMLLLSRFNLKSRAEIILLFLIFSFQIYMVLLHPPTALVAFIIIGMFGIVNVLFRNWKAGFAITGTAIALFICAISLPFLWTANVWGESGIAIIEGGQVFLAHLSMLDYIETFGFWLFILGFCGLFMLMHERKMLPVACAASVSAVGVMALAFRFVLVNMNNIQALLDRTTFLFFGLLSIVAGKALSWTHENSKCAAAIIVPIILVFSIYSSATTPYYKIIDEQEYDDFIWIRDNLNASYDRAILDPWKAIAFSPITQKYVHYQIPQGPDADFQAHCSEIEEFFEGNCSDTEFLITYGITIVYTHSPVINEDLTEVHPDIYILTNNS